MDIVANLIAAIHDRTVEAEFEWSAACYMYANHALNNERARLVGVSPMTSRLEAIAELDSAVKKYNAAMLAAYDEVSKLYKNELKGYEVWMQYVSGLITIDECINCIIDAEV